MVENGCQWVKMEAIRARKRAAEVGNACLERVGGTRNVWQNLKMGVRTPTKIPKRATGNWEQADISKVRVISWESWGQLVKNVTNDWLLEEIWMETVSTVEMPKCGAPWSASTRTHNLNSSSKRWVNYYYRPLSSFTTTKGCEMVSWIAYIYLIVIPSLWLIDEFHLGDFNVLIYLRLRACTSWPQELNVNRWHGVRLEELTYLIYIGTNRCIYFQSALSSRRAGIWVSVISSVVCIPLSWAKITHCLSEVVSCANKHASGSISNKQNIWSYRQFCWIITVFKKHNLKTCIITTALRTIKKLIVNYV